MTKLREILELITPLSNCEVLFTGIVSDTLPVLLFCSVSCHWCHGRVCLPWVPLSSLCWGGTVAYLWIVWLWNQLGELCSISVPRMWPRLSEVLLRDWGNLCNLFNIWSVCTSFRINVWRGCYVSRLATLSFLERATHCLWRPDSRQRKESQTFYKWEAMA